MYSQNVLYPSRISLLKKHGDAASLLNLHSVTSMLARYDINKDESLSPAEFGQLCADLDQEKQRLVRLERQLSECGFEAFDMELLHSQIKFTESGM